MLIIDAELDQQEKKVTYFGTEIHLCYIFVYNSVSQELKFHHIQDTKI